MNEDGTNELPDIRDRFKARTYEVNGRVYKELRGELGTPGEVLTHRDRQAQASISRGTGEDAGHMIDNRFGRRATTCATRPNSARVCMYIWALPSGNIE